MIIQHPFDQGPRIPKKNSAKGCRFANPEAATPLDARESPRRLARRWDPVMYRSDDWKKPWVDRYDSA